MISVRFESFAINNRIFLKAILSGDQFTFEGLSEVGNSFWKARMRALYEVLELAELYGYGSVAAPLRAWLKEKTQRVSQYVANQQVNQQTYSAQYTPQPQFQPQPQPQPQYTYPTTPATPTPKPQQQRGGDVDPFDELLN